jgi:hypothetical protein
MFTKTFKHHQDNRQNVDSSRKEELMALSLVQTMKTFEGGLVFRSTNERSHEVCNFINVQCAFLCSYHFQQLTIQLSIQGRGFGMHVPCRKSRYRKFTQQFLLRLY